MRGSSGRRPLVSILVFLIPDSMLKFHFGSVDRIQQLIPSLYSASSVLTQIKITMKLAIVTLAAVLGLAQAFTSPALVSRNQNGMVAFMSTMAEAGVPPSTSDASDVAEIEIPTNLPSEKGMDYVPLATMLATGQLAEADQVRNSPMIRPSLKNK